ncbi:MAG: GNAT family N-acetyltransferase [Beijerinckiaceae bacterium]|nr:GNAT family N-acetyltransferase [Beijerinckiaceae bacterium]
MFPDLTRDDVFRLETARLWLRWPRSADAVSLSKLAGVREVAEMTASIPHPYTEQDATRWIFSARAGNALGSNLALVIARRGRPTEAIGSVGLHQTRPGVALVGYWLGRQFQGRGFVTEAVETMVDTAFRLADVGEIHAQARIENEASRRVLEKCGFSSEGRAQIDLPARGGVVLCERFRLTREFWVAGKACPLQPARPSLAATS